MELELYVFVYCVKHPSQYLLGKQFIVRTDHKNLVYLANETVSNFVRWSIEIQVSYRTHPRNI
jgi:hypothetical protein